MERARRLANRATILNRLITRRPSPSTAVAPPRQISTLVPTNPTVHNHHHHHFNQTRSISLETLRPTDTFPRRHNSATPSDETKMSESVGFPTLDALIDATVPSAIRSDPMRFGNPRFDLGLTESLMVAHMEALAAKNRIFKSFIGMGCYGTHVPAVILRNIMENPGWYTQYTPCQAEIAQGRLESLLNFQTMVSDVTGLPMSNASLLDEGTAAAEAMAMCNSVQRGSKRKTFVIVSNCHPQTIDGCRTRADGFGLSVKGVDLKEVNFGSGDVCGVLVQYSTRGRWGRRLIMGSLLRAPTRMG